MTDSSDFNWFDSLYAGAGSNMQRVPWAIGAPRPAFARWLNERRPAGDGRRAAVVGCGLGDDAEALAACGFHVTAFDVSPAAIDWCRRRFPNSPVDYQVADLFAAPSGWHAGFDFVLEIFTVQALPVVMRVDSVRAVANLVAPGGQLLVIAIGTDDPANRCGPPWPLTVAELELFRDHGLEAETVGLDRSLDPPHFRITAEYTRPLTPTKGATL